ncbi:lysophosphatidic acid receptor 3-like [Mercenaria mercenaria]|uniref:lysophosphatidic acid receptor 3-like n=1 Tax=Mercenaria mercenaria TaxID=6596 RepID=UPI00234E408F|nr:lysophosphatidic acid receptor 3-like [Mercenaria mercenaria]
MMLTKPKMALMICFGWTVVAINSSIPLYGVNSFTNSSTECAHNVVWPEAYQMYNDWLLTTALIVNFVFYMIVVRIAVKKARRRNYIGGNKHFNIHAKAKTDLQHMVTMVIVLGTFVLCWLPYVTLIFMVTFWDTPNFQFVKRCTLIIGLLNSAMNWLIYGYRNKEFRKAFKSTLKCKFCYKDDNRLPPSAATSYRASSVEF